MPAVPGLIVYLPVGEITPKEQRWQDKASGDVLPLTLDATNFLAACNGDSIVASSVTVASIPPGLILAAPVVTATTIMSVISGGVTQTPVQDYGVRHTFSTAGGMKLVRDVWIRVRPISPNTTFGTDVVIGGVGITGLSFNAATSILTLELGDGTALTASLAGAS